MKNKIIPLIILGLVMVCVTFGLYPSFADSVSHIKQISTIGSFSHTVEAADMKGIKEAKAEAKKYNEEIWKNQQKESYRYAGSKATDPEYESILNISGDGVMGYISIPKIDIDLPIRHGTSSEVLEEGAGHVYGTSVPIGGENTHSVISAHTGLESARMFTDLTKLKKDDYFSIHVANEVHYYLIDKIRTVLPEDADEYLQIEPGKSLVTLYTCTPYGINTHRLLVRAHEISAQEYKRLSKKEHHTSFSLSSLNVLAFAKSILLGSIPAAVLITGIIIIFKPRKRRKNEKFTK